MKKKEQPKKKQKEFSASPFQALKGAALALGKQGAAPPPPPGAPKKVEPDDFSLFLDAVSDVRRLNPSPPRPAGSRAPESARAERDDEERRVFLQAVEALKMDVRFSDLLPEEPVPRPAPANRLRQLRRGAIRIDLQLDLHGLTRDEAVENLERFVRGAYNRGQKGVLVITGKGHNSQGEPVLKSAVAAWLRESGKGMVSEFLAAPREMGGSGAFVVFLKKKEEPPA